MSDITTIVSDYIATWNETDGDRRRALVDRVFAADATYVDPLMQSAGGDGIDAMIAGAQQAYPGHRFQLSAGPDAHNDRVRFSWAMYAPDGAHVATGIDFASLAGDGRLREVTGFLEPAA